MRLFLLMFVGGIMVIFHGYEELKLSRKSATAPIKIELAAIEAGKLPAQANIVIGEHLRLYPASVYSFSRKKGESGQPGPGTRVNYLYYPVLSADHPFLKEMQSLIEKYGALDKVPSGVKRPQLTDFAVLVKSQSKWTIGEIPNTWVKKPTVSGLVVNDVDPLKDKETALIRETFPRFDVTRTLVLEEGREPKPFAYSLAMFVIGPILMGLPIFLAMRKSA